MGNIVPDSYLFEVLGRYLYTGCKGVCLAVHTSLAASRSL